MMPPALAPGLAVMHPPHRAGGQDARRERADQRPEARIDQVIGMVMAVIVEMFGLERLSGHGLLARLN